MAISREDIAHLAQLAGLDLQTGEIVQLEADLTRILDYLRILTAAEGTTAPHDPPGSLRSDEPGTGTPHDVALSNAPEARDGCFRVPRVVASGEDCDP